MSVLAGVDPNEDNFVSVWIINTRTTLIGCLLRLEHNKEKRYVISNMRIERERQGSLDRGGGGREKWREEGDDEIECPLI